MPGVWGGGVLMSNTVANETLDAMCAVCGIQGATLSMKPVEMCSEMLPWSRSTAAVGQTASSGGGSNSRSIRRFRATAKCSEKKS